MNDSDPSQWVPSLSADAVSPDSSSSEWGSSSKRVCVIGNGGGGKSTIARALARATGIPYYEVDQIQFRPGWSVAPAAEVESRIESIIEQDRWILDGFGPWSTIESRFQRCDVILWVDHPLWVHFWWAAERQMAAARGEVRFGGPDKCPLEDVTRQMFETIGRVHEELRPKILKLIEQRPSHVELKAVHSPEELESLLAAIGPPKFDLQA